jgi:hypothetical protein
MKKLFSLIFGVSFGWSMGSLMWDSLQLHNQTDFTVAITTVVSFVILAMLVANGN